MKCENTSREELAERLRRAGIGVTFQRLEIAQVLFARRQHLSADQILQAVNSRNVNASKATVYNTLRLFVEKGLLSEVVIDSARIVYDSEVAPHYHIYDVDSGELTDLSVTDITVSGLPAMPRDKRLDRVDVVLRVRSAVSGGH